MKRPKRVYRVRWWMYGLATLFGLPFAAVGLVLFIPIITVPIGFLLILLGAYPLYHLHHVSVYWNMQQEHAHVEYTEEGVPASRPWEDDALIISMEVGDIEVL